MELWILALSIKKLILLKVLLQSKNSKDKFFPLSNLGFCYLITYIRIGLGKNLTKMSLSLY
jgi:hypothetical protein